MKNKLFLFHWNKAEATSLAKNFRNEGWTVGVESKDGAHGGKKVVNNPPDAVLIYLSRLPSHGRATAGGLRSLKATREVPIVFVDGEREAREQTKAVVPDAIYTTSAKVKDILAKYSHQPTRKR